MPLLIPPADGDAWISISEISLHYPEQWTAEVEVKAVDWLSKAIARAKTVAPCLINPETLPDHVQEAAKGILINAVLRLINPTVTAGTQYQTAGPFAVNTDTKLRSDRVLSRPDRDELQELCRSVKGRTARRSIAVQTGYRR